LLSLPKASKRFSLQAQKPSREALAARFFFKEIVLSG